MVSSRRIETGSNSSGASTLTEITPCGGGGTVFALVFVSYYSSPPRDSTLGILGKLSTFKFPVCLPTDLGNSQGATALSRFDAGL